MKRNIWKFNLKKKSAQIYAIAIIVLCSSSRKYIHLLYIFFLQIFFFFRHFFDYSIFVNKHMFLFLFLQIFVLIVKLYLRTLITYICLYRFTYVKKKILGKKLNIWNKNIFLSYKIFMTKIFN